MTANERKRYRFEVDALTPGDAEYSSVSHTFANSLNEAIDETRNNYEQGGDLVFRLRMRNLDGSMETVWLAKGQDW